MIYGRTLIASVLVGSALVAGTATAQTLRIGLASDPDILDPTQSRTYVGRIVFAALCDKLFDIGTELEIVPQLATKWQWTDGNKGLVITLRPGVRFHDGEPLVYLPIPDSTVRLANLQSGGVDMIEGVAATDFDIVRKDRRGAV